MLSDGFGNDNKSDDKLARLDKNERWNPRSVFYAQESILKNFLINREMWWKVVTGWVQVIY